MNKGILNGVECGRPVTKAVLAPPVSLMQYLLFTGALLIGNPAAAGSDHQTPLVGAGSASLRPMIKGEVLAHQSGVRAEVKEAHMNYAYETLRIVVKDGVVVVTIANPPLNLLDAKLLIDLDSFAAAVANDQNVKVIVFESRDPDFFVPHGDMGFVDDPASFAALAIGTDQDQRLNPMQRLFERIRRLPQVTIGKLAGRARGGGAELLQAMDMRFASLERGYLAQMEAPTGIIPGAGGTVYLPRLVGRARAMEIVLGADLFDAATAERYGWINRALPDAELDKFVARLSRNIARLPDGVIGAAKSALDSNFGDPTNALLEQNRLLGETFKQPAAADLTRKALKNGAQTRQGERNLEAILHDEP